jgi:glutamate dehydrogenase (NADP+)
VDREKLAYVMDLKDVRRGRIAEYAERYLNAVYTPVDHTLGYNPLWAVEAECAFPSAVENEINGDDAKHLLEGGVTVVSEGANMPTTPEGVDRFLEAGILYGPGKAANAGGVAVSGLEMVQNAAHIMWPRDDVDERLQQIMRSIHETCRMTAHEFDVPGNYVVGANIAGFRKVAEAMIDQGVV